MSENGFYLSKLKITGDNKKPAEIGFTKGLNLISGSSDTGKSYIFSCLNFVLGSSSKPEVLSNFSVYNNFYLEIITFSDITFTLKRNIDDKKTIWQKCTLDKFNDYDKKTELKSKPNKKNNVDFSFFLLQLSGFKQSVVRTNNHNKTQSLSFRSIAQFLLVDEETIITKNPLIHPSGQYTTSTKDHSIFKFLLTGIDDKESIPIEEPKIRKSRLNGQLEIIENRIEELNNIIESYKQYNVDNLSNKEKINLLKVTLNDYNQKITDLSSKRKDVFDQITAIESKILFQNELIERFTLLQKHYQNDIQRLNFILEGEYLFAQLNTVKCPICGGNLDQEHFHNTSSDVNNWDNITSSIEKEVSKLNLKLKDLNETTNQLIIEKDANELVLSNLNKENVIIIGEIQSNLEPQKLTIQKELDTLVHEINLSNKISYSKEQLQYYNNRKIQINQELKTKISTTKEYQNQIKVSSLNDLSEVIKKILNSWQYPNIKSIQFADDINNFDFLINNQSHNSHGKGYRAIIFSAFIIGLMDYCIQKNLPHPRFVILDSPLTSFRPKDSSSENEEITQDMQTAFFDSLSKISLDRQVIIFDNKEPNEEIKSKMNYIHFTGDSNVGRQGFFPLQ